MSYKLFLAEHGSAPTAAGIYAVESPAGDCYVGASADIRGRLRRHYSSLKKGYGQKLLQTIANRYGVNSLTFRVLEECSREDLERAERYWQDQLKPNLCIAFGGWPCNRKIKTATEIVSATLSRNEAKSFAKIAKESGIRKSHLVRRAVLLLLDFHRSGRINWAVAPTLPGFVRD